MAHNQLRIIRKEEPVNGGLTATVEDQAATPAQEPGEPGEVEVGEVVVVVVLVWGGVVLVGVVVVPPPPPPLWRMAFLIVWSKRPFAMQDISG